MRRSGRAAVVLAIAGAGLFAAAAQPASSAVPTAPSGSPMTFDEVLHDQRTLKLSRFAPAGDAILLSLERNDRPSRGAPWKVTSAESRVIELGSRASTAIAGVDGAFMPSPCEPWSPSGRYVAGFVLRRGDRRLAVWDRRTHGIVVFKHVPTVQCPRWAGDVLIYPAADATTSPPGSSSERVAMGQVARWRAAWFGSAAQVTVHSSNPAFPEPAGAVGGLALADPRRGASTWIARGDFHSVTPAPDGGVIAVVRYGARDPRALSVRTGRLGDLEIYRVATDVHRNQVTATLVRRVRGFDVDYAGLSWSATGRHLLAIGRPAAEGGPGVLVLDGLKANPRRLVLPADAGLAPGEPGSYSRLRAGGWIGTTPAVLAVRRGATSTPAASASEYLPAPGAVRLLALTASGAQDLTAFAAQSAGAFAGGRDGALVVLDGALWQVAPDREPRRVSPEGMRVTALAAARPSLGLAPVWAATDHRAAVTARGAHGTLRRIVLDLERGEAVLSAPAAESLSLSPALDVLLRQRAEGWSRRLDLAGARSGRLLTLNAGWRNRAVATPVRFTYEVGGRSLLGWALLPAGDRRGPLPTVVWLYGGQLQGDDPPPESRAAYAGSPVFAGQLWAARGYAVLYPSTPIRGGARSDVPAELAEAVVAALDAASQRGWVDPHRVGLLGHSFGAVATAAVLSRRSDRFAAGIAISGAYDFAAAWGARGGRDWMEERDGASFREETVGRVERGQIALGRPPFEDSEAYRRASPFYAAAAIRTPLLLAVGDLEPGVTGLGQAERMYAALSRTGNATVMVRYWGQGHVQDDPWACADQWTRFSGWFDHYLRPGRRDPNLEPNAVPAAGPAREPASGAPTIPPAPPSSAGPPRATTSGPPA